MKVGLNEASYGYDSPIRPCVVLKYVALYAINTGESKLISLIYIFNDYYL
jgi:hypothetical protein